MWLLLYLMPVLVLACGKPFQAVLNLIFCIIFLPLGAIHGVIAIAIPRPSTLGTNLKSIRESHANIANNLRSRPPARKIENRPPRQWADGQNPFDNLTE